MSWILLQFLEVVEFVGKRTGRYYFDLAVIVDEDVVRVDIAYLSPHLLELIPCPDQVVKQIPHLSFEEVTIYVLTIGYLGLQKVWIVVIGKLSYYY